MSRALDAETIAAMQKNSASAYSDIAKVLSTRRGELLEIEILGKSHPFPAGVGVLVDGHNIAISKVSLVQAFLRARQLLFEHLKASSSESGEQLQAATAIVLLLDPEHLTAANTRKRLIQERLLRSRGEVEASLKDELFLVDSYLTSRLHRHTKSPTLWSHRRWILNVSQKYELERDITKELKLVVLVAAERHPRNYYAFSHMRWLCEAFSGKRTNMDSSTHSSSSQHADLVCIVKDWCLRHPSDTSGFSFLLYCLTRTPTGSRSAIEISNERSLVLRDVFKPALSFKWTHESVWAFLRTLVAAAGTCEGDVVEFHTIVKTILGAAPEHKTIQAADEWCSRYQTN